MLCSILSFFISVGCGSSEPAEPAPTHTPKPTASPSPSPEPSPPYSERKATSTDGKSMWEYKYELLCGCKFTRDPMTPEEIAAQEAEQDSPTDGRFIFIPNK